MIEADTDASLTATIDADTFRPFVTAAHALVSEAKWRFDASGLTVCAVDPANVGMLTAELGADAFDAFAVERGTIGLNYSRLADMVHPEVTPEGAPVTFETVSHRRMDATVGAFEYDLALIDPSSLRKEPDLPDLDLPAEVSVTAGALQAAVKRADAVSSHAALAFDADARTLTLDADGETDGFEWRAAEDATADQAVHRGGDARSNFSLDYLKDLVHAPAADTRVRLEVGEEFPVGIMYDIADGAGHVRFMLAPRIQG